MTRFSFFTDIHLSGMIPRHRRDDFPQTMLNKLREIYSVSEELGCDFVAFGGDFFHTHRIYNYDVISGAMDIICGSKIPTYACIGEHDLFGHSPKTYYSSTLAFMIRHCSNFRILFEPVDLGEVVLQAKHEWEKMDEAMERKVDPNKINVLVCHELITSAKRAMFEIIDTSTLTNSPFDVVVSGDLHCGYEVHSVGKTTFCNPGSVARRAINEMDRTPQFAIIEVSQGKTPYVYYRPISCAIPGKEVFEENIAELVMKSAESVEFNGEGFAKEMMEFEADSVDIHELIQKVGVKNGLRKEVLDYLAQKKEIPTK